MLSTIHYESESVRTVTIRRRVATTIDEPVCVLDYKGSYNRLS